MVSSELMQPAGEQNNCLLPALILFSSVLHPPTERGMNSLWSRKLRAVSERERRNPAVSLAETAEATEDRSQTEFIFPRAGCSQPPSKDRPPRKHEPEPL